MYESAKNVVKYNVKCPLTLYIGNRELSIPIVLQKVQQECDLFSDNHQNVMNIKLHEGASKYKVLWNSAC